MLKGFFSKFKKEEEKLGEEIYLSKIDKHMNFILRDRMGFINKSITEKVSNIAEYKENILVNLRALHKAKLMNANIPEREINIMEGNRENYIKKVSHLATNLNVPKNYLDAHDYCVKFSSDLEQLNKDVQKNIFVLSHFFANEVKNTNKALHDLEERIIDIRVMLEKNGILYLKDIQKDIKQFIANAQKIRSFKEQVETEKNEIAQHQEKLDKLNERIKTITAGTDYKALESFKEEKSAAETEMKDLASELSLSFSMLDTALKKYYYLNPDKKIAREYLDNLEETIISDKDLAIVPILKDIRSAVERNEIDLKDKKKEHCIEAIEKLSFDYLKDIQSKLHRLDDARQRAQAKITHNSASLNLSEQQYWISATEDKIKYHNANIEKLEKNINSVDLDNAQIMSKIRIDMEKLTAKKIELKDDISKSIIEGKDLLSDSKVEF